MPRSSRSDRARRPRSKTFSGISSETLSKITEGNVSVPNFLVNE